MNSRATTANILYQVIDRQRSLSSVLPEVMQNISHPEERAFIQELSFGTLRWFHRLKAISPHLLLKPIKAKENIIFYLLLLGLYQLAYTRIPDYAAVSETIEASKQLNSHWAAALLNKTLRRFINEKENILNKIDKNLEALFSHPNWMIDSIKKEWPENWQCILNENNKHPPLFLRINQRKINRDDYLKLLLQHDQSTSAVIGLENGILLEKPVPVDEIMGFREGFCSIQDSASQKASELLDLMPGQSVLDACAAPGNKTSHILEIEPQLERLFAIDIDPIRIKKIKENISRLQLNHSRLRLILADAGHTKEWWDGHLFDRILLDAPCSSSGVIRRHPDIKILRHSSDIKKLAQQQLYLLNALWPLLKRKGKLLYTTCSIFETENEQTMTHFLQEHDDAKVLPIQIEWGHSLAHGIQLLPGDRQMDGFYYASIQKT